MGDVTVEIKGLKELDQFLKSLPEQIQRKALVQANLAGAAVIREEAKLRAPVRSDTRAMKVGKNSTKATLPGFLRAFDPGMAGEAGIRLDRYPCRRHAGNGVLREVP